MLCELVKNVSLQFSRNIAIKRFANLLGSTPFLFNNEKKRYKMAFFLLTASAASAPHRSRPPVELEKARRSGRSVVRRSGDTDDGDAAKRR